MSANDKQVAGSHYRAKIQHWDFVEINGLGYLEGCATKYATRARKKHEDPLDDLNKALHYVEKLRELHAQGKRRNRRGRWMALAIPVSDFAAANGLTDKEQAVVELLTTWYSLEDLDMALDVIRDMIKEAERA